MSAHNTARPQSRTRSDRLGAVTGGRNAAPRNYFNNAPQWYSNIEFANATQAATHKLRERRRRRHETHCTRCGSTPSLRRSTAFQRPLANIAFQFATAHDLHGCVMRAPMRTAPNTHITTTCSQRRHPTKRCELPDCQAL